MGQQSTQDQVLFEATSRFLTNHTTKSSVWSWFVCFEYYHKYIMKMNCWKCLKSVFQWFWKKCEFLTIFPGPNLFTDKETRPIWLRNDYVCLLRLEKAQTNIWFVWIWWINSDNQGMKNQHMMWQGHLLEGVKLGFWDGFNSKWRYCVENLWNFLFNFR